MVHPGWRGESGRHSAAARGIPTGRKPTKSTHPLGSERLLYFRPQSVHHPDDEKVVEVEWNDGRKETFYAASTSYGPVVDVRNKKGRIVGYDRREDVLRVFEEDGSSIRINMDEVKQIRMHSPAGYFRGK